MPRRAAPARKSPKQRANASHFDITPDMRRRVEALVTWGYTKQDIANCIINPRTGRPIAVETLDAHFAFELEIGSKKTTASVIETLYRLAVGHPNIFDPNTGKLLLSERSPELRAIELWMKKALGWSGEAPPPPPVTAPLVIVVDNTPDAG